MPERQDLHAVLSILDAGSRGQWPPSTFDGETVRKGYESVKYVFENWNRRMPDLTEALARLKALEEELIAPCVYESGGYDCKGCHPCGWLRSRAKEIAAIRKALRGA